MNTRLLQPCLLATLVLSGLALLGLASQPPSSQPPTSQPGPRPRATPDGERAPKPHRPVPAPDYVKSQDAKGVIRSVGSSTVSGLINDWAAAFNTLHPGATVEVTGGGSSTATPALLSGTCDIAPMSRPMNDAELSQFKQKFGYEPTRIVVAIDALAVFVHKDNPIPSLSLAELDSIFSATRKRGGEPAETWGDLGLEGDWIDRPIHIYGFGDLTGGYALFRDLVLDGGDYNAAMRVQPGSSAIVNAVGAYREAIGFASQYFATARTRMVPLEDEGGVPRDPTEAACLDGSYPLARRLFVYVNKRRGEPLSPEVAEFLRYALSRQGQSAAADAGMFAVPGDLAKEQIEALDR